MLGKLGGTGRSRCVLAVLALALGATAPGCIGNRLGLSQERHALLETTKQVRGATLVPPDMPRELDKHVLPPYLVEPGDVLLVTVADLDSPIRLPGDQPVMPDGTITLGPYGRPIVAGKNLEEIEGMVRAMVQPQSKELVKVTVRLVSRQSQVYYVIGEVNAPGAFPLTGRETVLDGILAAGGLTDGASRRDIILSRPTRPGDCRVVLPVCFREIVQLGDTTTNYQLHPGDRIFVPTRTCWEDVGKRKDTGPCAGCQLPCGK
jgi:protein involved in polysaccharide export with SLBB domain